MDSFNKLKRKYLAGAVIKSLLCALAAFLAAFGIALLAFKLSAAASVAYSLIAGAGAAVVAGGVAFLAMRPTDKRVAKKLDDEYALNERAQTMLAYGGRSGGVVELQREDAGKKLSALSVPAVTFKKIWKFLAVVAVSAAVTVTGALVPGKTAAAGGTVGGDDSPVTVTGAQKIRLRELISDIESSRLSEDLIPSFTAPLEELEAGLDAPLTLGGLRSAVEKASAGVTAAAKVPATYAALADAFAPVMPGLASALEEGGDAYRYFGPLKYSDVQSFYEVSYDAVREGMDPGFATFRQQFIYTAQEGQAESEAIEATRTLINTMITNIQLGVALSNLDVATDPLCIEFWNLTGDLANVRQEEAESTGGIQEKLDSLFAGFGFGLAEELSAQSYGLLLAKYARNALAQIFPELGLKTELAEERRSDGQGVGPGGPGGQGEGSGGDGGGAGSGSMTYGSADEIYDPATGTYRKYGELLSEYYAMVQEMLGGSEITDAQKNAIKLYFDILYGINAGN